MVRVFAVILILGQVVQASGGAVCGLQRRHDTGHCDTMQQTAGATLTAPAHDMAGGLCSLIGPCAAPVPAVATLPASNEFDLAVLRGVASARTVRLLSFNPTPISPPPQV